MHVRELQDAQPPPAAGGAPRRAVQVRQQLDAPGRRRHRTLQVLKIIVVFIDRTRCCFYRGSFYNDNQTDCCKMIIPYKKEITFGSATVQYCNYKSHEEVFVQGVS